MNTQPQQQVTAPLVTASHNAMATLVALYGEMLRDQEKKLQAYAAQMGSAQQQCAQLVQACKDRDLQIEQLQAQISKLTPAAVEVGLGG